MCVEPTARPPAPPRSGFRGETERVTLTGADGNAFAATRANSTAPTAPGVVVLPDVRGLHPYYDALAEAFADAGVHALAIDLYGRPADPTDAGIRSDVRAAVEALRGHGATAVYVLGLCCGGRSAFMQSSEDGIAGVVGFYGSPARVEDGGSSIEAARAGRFKAPVLALYGGADEEIPDADIEAFYNALSAAHVLEETVVYEGAPHSFFDVRAEEHAEACDDAWHRVLRFMGVPVTA